MTRFCISCGKEISEGMAFCTECGTPAPQAAVAVAEAPVSAAVPAPAPAPQAAVAVAEAPVSVAVPAPAPVPPASYQQPYAYAAHADCRQPVAVQETKPKGRYGVLSTGAFFGLILLFGIPVIGWITCIILAFAPKNENLKHYTRATLIWLIIGLVLCVAGYILVSWLGDALQGYINDLTGG